MNRDVLYVSTPQIDYTISLEKKITYILGDSGVGKTTLFDYLKDYIQVNDQDLEPYLSVEMLWDERSRMSRRLIETFLKEKKDIESSVVVYCKKILVPIDKTVLEKYTEDEYSIFLEANVERILYCDEDVIINPLFDTFLKICIESRAAIKILIAGRLMCGCPYLDAGSLHTLVYDKESNLNKNVSLYNHLKAPSRVNVVLVEDDKSGFEFYKMYFKKYNIPVFSIKGKNNIFRVLASLDYSKHYPYIICDGYSFANVFLKLSSYLKDIHTSGYWIEDEEDTSRLFCQTCLEDLTLNSKWIKKGLSNFETRELEALKRLINRIDAEINDLPEKISALQLSSLMKFSCGSYSKKLSEKNCLVKHCMHLKEECNPCFCNKQNECKCHFYSEAKVLDILDNYRDILPSYANRDHVRIGSVVLSDKQAGIFIDNEITIFGKTNTTFVFKETIQDFGNLESLTFEELSEAKHLIESKFTWKTYERFHSKDSIQRKLLSFSLKDDNSKNDKAKCMKL